MPTVGVLIVHGMGTQDNGYADKLIRELRKRLGRRRNEVAWRPVYWADVLSARQNEYLADAEDTGLGHDWGWLRRFVVSALSDAASYRWMREDSLTNPTTTYGRIHQRVLAGLQALRHEVGSDGKLVVLAHSLGGHVMSNYLWDAQHPESPKVSPPVDADSYVGGGTLRLFVTFGCNIPLFTFALDEVVPIELQHGAKWRNYFDRDDVLGYPLQPINAAYARVCRDIEIAVGMPFTVGATPFSHGKYWTDNDFTKPVAKLIRRVVDE